jgi:digeranylgeranylglycerophospholipid reductase
MYDLAVIGAGPAGCLLARLIGSAGFSVVILEEHASAGEPVNCSGIIGVEAFHKFDLPQETIIRPIDSFRFFSPSGAVLEYRHIETLAFAVNRSLFDIAMADRATSAGAELRLHSRVNKVVVNRDFVELTVNRDQVVRSKFVAIATGAGSTLTEQLGLGPPQKYVLGAQLECETLSLNDVEIHFGRRVAPSNFAWVIPLQKGRAKIGLICQKNARSSLEKFLLQPSLRNKIVRQGKILCSLLPLETIQKSYAERTLVLGEAAGQIKTITCGGIYYGMLAAELASEVLKEAIGKNSGHASDLAAYEERWRDLLQRELELGSRVRFFFNRLSDFQINSMFDVALKDGIMKLISEKVSFDWHYELINAVFRHSLVKALFQPMTYAKLLL